MGTTDTDTGAAKTGAPEDGGLGAAGSQLSTAPAEERGQAVPGSFGGARRPGALGAAQWLGREATGWLRWCWRQLTSMRVALLLLFMLSMAAIPGSLVPQDSIEPLKAEDFKARHETLTPIYEKLQLFNVYSSVWFSAIYILLFISLIGCIVPRTWQFIGQLRGRPPAAPRNLSRLPAYTSWRTGAAPEEVLRAAGSVVGRRRFRNHVTGGAVAAEKGYLREAGNLVFHIALIVMLVSFAAGQLWKSEGGKLVVEGDGFSNNLTQYDNIQSGPLFKTDDLTPFGFQLEKFEADYIRSGPQLRTPTTFRARVTYWEGADGPEKKKTIEVNHPLEVQGYKVFLLGHGYAPVVTVRDGQGDIAFRGPVASLPLEGANLTSNVVIKVPHYRNKDGEKDQIAFQGQFVPTLDLRTGTMFSQFPALDNPALILTAYRGSLGINGGTPQNVYQLDESRMKQFKERDRKTGETKNFARALKVGESLTLPDGAGTLEFTGIKEWATFQISHKPGTPGALAGAIAALIGLAASLFIQRRRVWVRAVAQEDGTTLVEMAGLGRSESARLPEELADLAVALQADAPPVPESDDAEATDPTDDDATTEGTGDAATTEATGDADAARDTADARPARDAGAGDRDADAATDAADTDAADGAVAGTGDRDAAGSGSVPAGRAGAPDSAGSDDPVEPAEPADPGDSADPAEGVRA
ncbi:cytochrome c biogenesis protein ResB [Streptomyces pactum]|uniref:Cytochrome c biogenesis protein ResB n=1 Tax=Streptomyces pactum TaxID=68249 RepID=A0ABS0NMA0_9ACTN|nr:cytochrome c biogenesis protein ResB [Streptomyces pactum]MBH5336329.1 cytochrome c biogenesis protein ResB [Streptomyces pactum]